MKQIILTLALVLAFTTTNAQSADYIKKAAYINFINHVEDTGNKYSLFFHYQDILVLSLHYDDLNETKKTMFDNITADMLYTTAKVIRDEMRENPGIIKALKNHGFMSFKYIYVDRDLVTHESVVIDL